MRIKKYRPLGRLDKTLRRILAYQHARWEYRQIWQFCKALVLCRDDDRQLTQTSIRDALKKLYRANLVFKPNHHPVTEIRDFRIREGFKSESAEPLLKVGNRAERW